MQCCKVRIVVIIMLSFQPLHPGSIRAWVANAQNGRIHSIDAVRRNEEGSAPRNFFFLLQNLAL